MEATGAESLINKIKPPRLEDAGLEDCALPPESIKEAFLKAASAVRSIVTDSDDEGESGGRCVEDPWEDSTDAPSEGCVVEKGGVLTEAPGDKVVVGSGGESEGQTDAVVGAGLPEGGESCTDGLRGLEIEGKGRGISGKILEDGKDDVSDEDKPTLAEGYA